MIGRDGSLVLVRAALASFSQHTDQWNGEVLEVKRKKVSQNNFKKWTKNLSFENNLAHV